MSVAQFYYRAEGKNELQKGELRLEHYELASRHNMRTSQLVNAMYPDADPRFGTAFEQGARSLGIFSHSDRKFGIVPSTVKEILNGECTRKLAAAQMTSGTSPYAAGTIVSPGSPVGSSTPASRVFFPEVVMTIMDAKLSSDYNREMAILRGMLASDETIASEVFTQPLIDRTAPEGVRSGAIGQNQLPRNMVSITTSQTSKAITTTSVGLQISEQAMGHATIDLVSIILAQQAEGELKAKLWEDITSIVAGNADAGQSAMTPVDGTTYDSAFTGGVVTQTGWLKMLWDPSRKVQYDSIICDMDDVLAIQKRIGRPVMFDPRISADGSRTDNVGDQGGYGLNIEPVLTNIETYTPNILVVPSGVLTAQHMLVFDSRYFLRRVTNSSATYSAVEEMVLQRSSVFRFDAGSMLYRLMEEAGKYVDYS